MKGLLPEEILWQRKKIGFSNPKKSWRNKGEQLLINELNNSKLASKLDVSVLRRNIKTLDERFLWRVLNFCIWYRVNKL